MTPIAILREDGGKTLVVDGAMSFDEAIEGRVSDHANVANQYVVDGRLIRPRLGTMECIFSPFPTVEGLSTGDKRIIEVRTWLEYVQENAVILFIQIPGQPIVENMVLESHSYSRGNSDSFRTTLRFKEVRIARIRSTTLTQAPKRSQGAPRGEFAAGLSPENNLGTKPAERISVAQSFLNSFSDTSQQQSVYQNLANNVLPWLRGQ